MMETGWKKKAASDVVNVVLGAFLFLSPWLFGYGPETAASWNAWLCGTVIASLAIAALTAYAEWAEWVSLSFGLWLALSPWLVGFSTTATAMRLHVGVGVVVALAAALRLWFTQDTTPRVTT